MSAAPTLAPTLAPTTAAPTLSPAAPTLPPTLEAPVTSSELRTTVAIYGSVGLACVIVHAFLRTYVRSKYSPRARHVAPGLAAPEVPRAPWKWFVPLLFPRADKLILDYVGLDAYVAIRFVGLACKLFAILAPLGLIVLGSAYAATGAPENLTSSTAQGDMSKLTLQFVSGGEGAGTDLLWLPCVFVYLFSGIGIYLLHREYLHVVPLQREFLLYKHQATYSVVVERIPPEINSRRALKRYFESLFPGTVRRIDLVPMNETTKELSDLVDERREVLANLEHAMLLEHWRNNGDGKKSDGTAAAAAKAGTGAGRNGPNTARGAAKKRRKRAATDDENNAAQTSVGDAQETESPSGAGLGARLDADSEATSGASDDGDDDSKGRDLESDSDAWRAQHIAFGEGKKWMGVRALCHGWLCYAFGNGEKVLSVQHYSRELDNLNERVAALQKQLRGEIYSQRDAGYKFNDGGSDDSQAEASGTTAQDAQQDGNVDDEEGRRFVAADRDGAGEKWAFSLDKHDEAEWLLGDHSYTRGSLGHAAAFVTFNNKTASTSVGRCMKSEATSMIVNPAPEPRDVNWERLGCHPTAVAAARVGVLALNTFLLLVFGVLTSTISVSANLVTLRTQWRQLDEFLQDNPWAEPIISQIAPLLLVIIFALVPPILNLILRLRCDLADSARENSFFLNYSVFLVFQLFLFFQISGAVFSVIAQSFDNPREFVNLLAQMIPSNATFFMQFITIRMFWILPGAELLRVGPIAVALLVRPLLCGIARTPREKRDDCCGCRSFGTPGDAWFGLLCANLYLVLCIGVTYSVIAPLVLVFALIYFMVALIVFRNQLLYVYVKEKEAGGALWPYLGMAYLAAFALMQLTMLGIFALSEGVAQSVLMVPPLLLTCAYVFFFYTLYDTNNTFVSLNDARRFDIRSEAEPDEFAPPPPPDFRYPALAEPAEMHPTSVPDMLKDLHAMESNKPEADPGASGHDGKGTYDQFDDLEENIGTDGNDANDDGGDDGGDERASESLTLQ